ncbi:hypothetical protein HPB51_007402 [Rhipicephalus microplus]|uniref:Uncharacterized protein n=1 Tax=Rhipicephalus microplus TaxID=6941 RepID=A0A9J6EZD3_RHIMP|nr:hypothetical protein HPB51_007402 [Rhipicephalus microplus]
MNTSTETLMAHLRVRTHGVEIITARFIGTTKSAAIIFFGPTLPRTVYYYGGELRCYPFRPMLQVCKLRLVRGGSPHRRSNLQKKRLKPPKPKQRQVQAGHSYKLQQGTSNDPPRTKNLRWFSSEEEENAYKSADDKHSSRSHSPSPGRKPHSPSKKSAPAPTQQNLHRSPPGRGAKGNGGDQGCTQQASSLPEEVLSLPSPYETMCSKYDSKSGEYSYADGVVQSEGNTAQVGSFEKVDLRNVERGVSGFNTGITLSPRNSGSSDGSTDDNVEDKDPEVRRAKLSSPRARKNVTCLTSCGRPSGEQEEQEAMTTHKGRGCGTYLRQLMSHYLKAARCEVVEEEGPVVLDGLFVEAKGATREKVSF